VIEHLRAWRDQFGIASVTVSNLLLAARIREALPELQLVASTLLEISDPAQVPMLNGIFDVIVPSTKILRRLSALKALRKAFSGRIRLIVNESCLAGCPYRTQHFYEMTSGFKLPDSLCRELLEQKPWLRLTGAWVLPQHLHLFDKLSDEFKLAGRVTLRNPDSYRRVLGAYIRRTGLRPDEIGGGPASVNWQVDISEEFYLRTLLCGQKCNSCDACRRLAKDACPPTVESCRGAGEQQAECNASLS